MHATEVFSRQLTYRAGAAFMKIIENQKPKLNIRYAGTIDVCTIKGDDNSKHRRDKKGTKTSGTRTTANETTTATTTITTTIVNITTTIVNITTTIVNITTTLPAHTLAVWLLHARLLSPSLPNRRWGKGFPHLGREFGQK